MDKQTLIGAGALTVIVLGIFFYSVLAPSPAGAPVTTSSPTLVLPSGAYREHAKYYDIEAYYASSTPLQEPANTTALALMKNFVAGTITDFRSNFATLTQENIQTIEKSGEDATSTLKIMYLISSSTHSLSYIFTIDEYMVGALHGSEYFKTFTFDTTSGKVLTLADLFLPNSDYLVALSNASRALLPAIIGENAKEVSIKNGTEPVSENFQSFFLDNSDFVILFPPYQVAAYSEGPQTLRVPTEQLRSILKQQYR